MLKEKSDGLYKEISERVGKNISQRDFSEWLGYFNVIKSKVFNGEARVADFDDFIAYTNQFSFPPPVENEEKEEPKAEEEISSDGKKVKPYQFTRIDRKQLEQSGALKPVEKIREEEPAPDADKKSPVTPPAPVVAKIIRGADPSMYREIPTRPISIGNGENNGVYLGEDFSSGAVAESAGESAGEAIRSLTESALSAEQKQELKPKAKEKSHFLPDLDQFEDFDDNDSEQELLSKDDKAAAHTPSDSPSPSVINAAAADDGFEPFIADDEKKTRSVENSLNAPKIKMPSGLAEEHEKEFLSDDSEKEQEVYSSRTAEKASTPSSSAYSRYSANSAYSGVKLNSSVSRADRLSEFQADEEKAKLMPEETEDLSKSRTKEKASEISRAAKVVSAYKTLSETPSFKSGASDISDDENGGKASDEFAKILNNIERNDGFDEENLPLDPDGVPLSHKTKHVMDAIMKNTGVSPSLIYGRRQAAEKNIVLDDSFGEAKK